MTDLLGPANAANAVTSRPVETRVFPSVDTFFKGCSSPSAKDGTAIQAMWLNGIMQQVRNAIRGRGITVNNADDDMLLKALKSVGVRYGVDTGLANAITVAFDVPVTTYGALARFLAVKIANANTSATTLAADGLVARAVVRPNGTALQSGDLVAGMVALFIDDDTKLQLIGGIPAAAGVTPTYAPGTIVVSFNDVPESGTLEANGAAVLRTTYSALFTKIGVKYGAGDGSTTFNIPDARGYFLRAWDHGRGIDPDAAARIARADGTAGNNVGTTQADALRSHNHGPADPTNLPLFEMHNTSVGNSGGNTAAIGTSNFSSTTGYTGGNETRPANINVMVCIAY